MKPTERRQLIDRIVEVSARIHEARQRIPALQTQLARDEEELDALLGHPREDTAEQGAP